MGDRGQIKFEYSTGDTIRLYTHWTGTELPDTLAAALDRGRPRWNDEPYLVRIIFSEMIKDDVMSETGYGIGPYDMGPDHEEIAISAKDSAVTVGHRTWSFDEFVSAFKMTR